MVVTFVVILIILSLILWFMVGSRKAAQKTFLEAKKLEEEKKYKEACYMYATAVLGGSLPYKDGVGMIKQLWEQFGPFDYSDVEKLCQQNDTKEGCGIAGHIGTMSIIEEAVTGEKRRFVVTKNDVKLK